MNNKINNFYELDAWKKGYILVLEIYKITKEFPKEELYGIVSQLRRAASSITANISEGFARYHYKDKVRFYHQARGSAAEVQNFLILASDLLPEKYSLNLDDMGEGSYAVNQWIDSLN